MAKRRSARAQPLRIDAGPDIRVARGEVEVGERPDIDNPNATVRGASLRDPIKDLIRSKSLTLHHLIAANRFRDLNGLAEGAREAAGGGTPAWARGSIWIAS
jgi:hypothetical protein